MSRYRYRPPAGVEIPYASFMYDGQVIKMDARQFQQALRDARLCRCHACLCCRARAYWLEVRGPRHGR